MDEAVKDIPVEDEALVEANNLDEDLELFDPKDVEETLAEEEEGETEVEPEPEEVDFKPLLNKLSENIKYMDNEITIESLEDVIEKYQKGLDYDRKTDKLKELENSDEMKYLKSKAEESGMTTKEYIQALQEYEIKQQEAQEQEELEEMIDSGVAEHIAKKVIETNRVARELQKEKAKLQEEAKTKELQTKKDAENEEFLRNYPNVDIKQIPKEVFNEAEKIGLLSAYARFENNRLRQELEVLKQNKTNKDSSPVKGTTEHGGIVIEKEDDFLKGLGID